jgi:hypothetical protein
MACTLVGGSRWLLACPVSPMRAIARVPLSNPAAALELPVDRGPKVLRFLAPADRRGPGRSGSGSGSGDQGAVFGGACGPAGRLERTVQKLLTPTRARGSGSRTREHARQPGDTPRPRRTQLAGRGSRHGTELGSTEPSRRLSAPGERCLFGETVSLGEGVPR